MTLVLWNGFKYPVSIDNYAEITKRVCDYSEVIVCCDGMIDVDALFTMRLDGVLLERMLSIRSVNKIYLVGFKLDKELFRQVGIEVVEGEEAEGDEIVVKGLFATPAASQMELSVLDEIFTLSLNTRSAYVKISDIKTKTRPLKIQKYLQSLDTVRLAQGADGHYAALSVKGYCMLKKKDNVNVADEYKPLVYAILDISGGGGGGNVGRSELEEYLSVFLGHKAASIYIEKGIKEAVVAEGENHVVYYRL